MKLACGCSIFPSISSFLYPPDTGLGFICVFYQCFWVVLFCKSLFDEIWSPQYNFFLFHLNWPFGTLRYLLWRCPLLKSKYLLVSTFLKKVDVIKLFPICEIRRSKKSCSSTLGFIPHVLLFTIWVNSRASCLLPLHRKNKSSIHLLYNIFFLSKLMFQGDELLE